jgi:hydrogenase maturation factor
LLQTCIEFIHTPGISVVQDALYAVQAGNVHAMHDPTEGGLATGLHEIAEAAGVGMHINYETIHIFPETEQLCQHYHLDPLGVIASGALVITADPQETPGIINALSTQEIFSTVIGKIVPAQEGRRLWKRNISFPLPIYHQDEITKIFI